MSVNLTASQVKMDFSTSWLDQLAYKNIISHFSFIEYGHLSIEFNGQMHHLGQPIQDAEVVARIKVNHIAVFRHIMLNGSIGAAEMYMLKGWDTPDLLSVTRLFCLNLANLNELSQKQGVFRKASLKFLQFLNRNSLAGSKKNISAHYDLGNAFFQSFLDSSMMYSAAVFKNEQSTLTEAAIYKLDLICRKLQLTQQDHLIEIGTGWGEMAIHAAQNYGCKVTTTTISQEQFNYAKQKVESLGLTDRVTVLCKDYRLLTGKFDKLVSIEMIEAVGHKYFEHYFEKCSSLLKSDGLALIQAITVNDQRYKLARDNMDFIQRYIFPGGCLPSNEIITRSISRNTDLYLHDLHDITHHYAKTLSAWRGRFFDNIDQIKEQGFDELFCRMWEYYLCYCEAGFQEKTIHTSQLLFSKPRARLITEIAR